MALLARCVAACAAGAVSALAQQPYVTSTPVLPPSVERSFGVSAAFAGDVNGDGAADLVIGSPYGRQDQSDAFTDRIPFPLAGSVAGFQVWTPSTGAIVRSVVVPLFSSSGYAIVDLGDIDGDGVRDHAVSDPTISSAGGPPSSGRVDAISGATGFVLWPWTGSPAGANAGVSMARIADVDGDGARDLLVGAPASSGIAGRVFVLSARTGVLLRTHVGVAGDTLGFATADAGDVDGDGVPDYAAGAPQAAAPGGGLVAGYLRLWSGATGAIIRTVNGTVGSDRFGRALATAGDLNGDSVPDLYVGAPARHGQGTPGSVHAISGANGATIFSATRGVAGDRYGWALAAVGDRNADGRIDCAVGTTAGVVEVVSGASGAVLATQSGLGGTVAAPGIDMRPLAVGDLDGNGTIDLAIGSSETAENGVLQVFTSLFGTPLGSVFGNDGISIISSVSALGDLDGDGIRDLAIGNRRANTLTVPDAGSVLLWSPGAAAPIAQILGSVALPGLGWSVCTLDDIDGDGVEDFLASSLVGAGTGTVTCFSGATRAVLYAVSGTTAGETFGYTLARLTDVDGDGKRDFAAGSPYASVAGTASTGRVRICSGANGATIATASGTGLEFFGATIAQTGDVDGDGSGDLIVGGPYSSFGGVSFGGVARIVSVRSGTVLRTHGGTASGIALGGGVCGIRDADFDGVGDYAIASPANTASGAATAGPVVIRSGATGAVIRSIAPTPIPPGFSVNDTFGFGLADAGDIDGDGGDDVVLGVQPWLGFPPAQAREVHVYSVATGALISRQVAAGGFTPGSPAVNAAGFDLSGDGVPDWAVIAPTAIPSAAVPVQIVSHAGVPVGSTSAGPGCNVLGGIAPVLQAMGGAPVAAAGAPAFGVLLSRALPFQFGIGTLGASNTSAGGTPLPLNLAVIGAPGCFLYNSADVLVPFYATADGRRGFAVPIPALPSLAGASAHFQVFLFGGASLAAATNGLSIVVQ